MSKFKYLVDFILLFALVVLSTIIAINLVFFSKALWHLIAAYWVVSAVRNWKDYIIKMWEGFDK